MSLVVATYLLYLAITIGLTIWVARVLAANGRRVLARLLGDEALGGALSSLLTVAFYLVTLGIIGLTLRTGGEVRTARAGLELLSSKIGVVLLVLGALHLANLALAARLGRRMRAGHDPEPTDAYGRQAVDDRDVHLPGGHATVDEAAGQPLIRHAAPAGRL